MKALTICQPYAYLITLPETDPRHKRVENRTWYTPHRGALAIHAGKSKEWLDTYDKLSFREEDNLVYGAVVATATLVACLNRENEAKWPRRFDWVKDHEHSGDEWLWVLEEVERLVRPIPCKGAQGIWDCALL